MNPAVDVAYRMSKYIPTNFLRDFGAMNLGARIPDNISIILSLFVEEHGIVTEVKKSLTGTWSGLVGYT